MFEKLSESDNKMVRDKATDKAAVMSSWRNMLGAYRKVKDKLNLTGETGEKEQVKASFAEKKSGRRVKA